MVRYLLIKGNGINRIALGKFAGSIVAGAAGASVNISGYKLFEDINSADDKKWRCGV